MDNNTIAGVFEEIANILDIQGADFFRINAYKRASITIANCAFDLRQMVEKNPQDIEKIPGIGKNLKDKIVELINTGTCKEYEDLKKNFPKGLLEMLRLRGIGPKKVKLFYSKLGITDLKQLKEAAISHKLQGLEKMGEKSEQDILKAIEEYSHFSLDRHLFSEALLEAEMYIEYMWRCKDVKKIQYAGSLRRAQDTIGDIDILVIVKNPEKSCKNVMKHFTGYKEILEKVSEGDTKSSVILQSGINVDLRVIDDGSFGAALHYFTGSKSHNIHIRDLAKKKGLKISEYGVFKGGKMIAGKTEEEIFKYAGLPFIIPELRKNDGEIEYGLKYKKFPKFIEPTDIKGDLHVHSVFSDGKDTLSAMADEFIKRNYKYFAITDHSSVMGITGGMGSRAIKNQWEEIDELNKKLKGKIKILKGCEVDILKDGSLDFSTDILKQLDVVIISAHMFNRLPKDEQTKRLIEAIENPYSMILGHPSGRLINKRAEMEFDVEKIIDACIQNKVAIEINSNPQRLDMIDKYVKIAKDKGAKFVINTDSHSTDQAEFMKFGVGIARRGWLTKEDVLNAQDLTEFDNYFQKYI